MTPPNLRFDNRFVAELPGDSDRRNHPRAVPGACWSSVEPTPVPAPRLLSWSCEMAAELGLTRDDVEAPWFAEVFAGNRRLPGMQPFAARYGGHQFGHWAGQLGDGRAISLGEVLGVSGRWELQLKGAGPTPYSRRGDGRAVLRSSIREFLCSEAMHHLGIPTTRALSLVLTGDRVMRDMMYDGNPAFEPGAVVCRVSPSFLRFGNFEIHAAHQELPQLEQLIDFTLRRDYPEFVGRPIDWFHEVCRRTAALMVEWMRVGFVHGVMNTDNLSILGLTIDYGPYGWLESYDPTWTPNTTDLPRRRYCFGQQPHVAQWNLLRLAEALATVLDAEELARGLELYVETYNALSDDMTARKFGFPQPAEADLELARQAYALMHSSELDFSWFFRALPEADLAALEACSYDLQRWQEHRDDWQDWLRRYQQRLQQIGEPLAVRRVRMEGCNPQFVMRNHLVQVAIERAEQGDLSQIGELLEAARHPYRSRPLDDPLIQKRPEWARNKPGCSMLSCSS